MNPGRKKIEEREAQFIATGDLILDEHGGEWEVIYPTPKRLVLKRTAGNAAGRTDSWWVEPTTLIRTRVPAENR